MKEKFLHKNKIENIGQNKNKFIIALDLDETLLDSKMQISPFSLKILQQCKDKGFLIVISSTRGYGSCKNIAKQIKADYVCCQSGNMIVDEKENIIYENSFSKQQVKDFINEVSKYASNIIVDSRENLFGGIGDTFAKKWKVVDYEVQRLYELPVYKICVQFNDQNENIIKEYCEKNGFVCRNMRTSNFLLITQAHSDKYYALQKLLQKLKLKLSNLIVFGDDNSDILSILKAKYGVAVANAREQVLQKARYQTESNDEDGVAIFLKEIFL